MAEKIEGTIQAINKDRDGLVLAGMEGWFNISQYRDPDLGPLIGPSLKQGQRVRVHFQTGKGGRRYMEDLELLNGDVPAPPQPDLRPAVQGTTVLPEPEPPPEHPATVLPVPLEREKAILFQTCLARAQEWVLARYPEGDLNRTDGQVLHMVDLYYHEGLKLIKGEAEPPPEQPA